MIEFMLRFACFFTIKTRKCLIKIFIFDLVLNARSYTLCIVSHIHFRVTLVIRWRNGEKSRVLLHAIKLGLKVMKMDYVHINVNHVVFLWALFSCLLKLIQHTPEFALICLTLTHDISFTRATKFAMWNFRVLMCNHRLRIQWSILVVFILGVHILL